MESDHPNCKTKVTKKSFQKNNLCNLNTKQYNCLINGDSRKIDQLLEKKIAVFVLLRKIIVFYLF